MRIKTLCISAIGIAVTLTGCHSEKNGIDSDTVVKDTVEAIEEPKHADNDIAMTVRSIVDAINMEEELDSASYTYEGILTDGSGKPLYTDTEGAPGVWEVRLAGPQSVSLRNTRPGDLLAEELCAYLTQSLELTDEALITARIYKDLGKEVPTNVKIYDFGKGTIHFETRVEDTTAGGQSPVLSIVISGNQQ
ncbi:MAG: hypothetical protein NC036_03425 [Muribaculaceae bacterium]|nr:hypothetical protein [Muribaculaceae bacterium]